MTNDLKSEFWNRLGKVQAGMLAVNGSTGVPMSPNADQAQNAIWFITAQGTDVHAAATGGAQAAFQIADPSANLYANVTGRLTAEDNQAKLDELWNVVAAAWFEDGRGDPDIRLLRLTPAKGEIWATTGAAGFIYEIAKANMTDSKPDMGEHGLVSF